MRRTIPLEPPRGSKLAGVPTPRVEAPRPISEPDPSPNRVYNKRKNPTASTCKAQAEIPTRTSSCSSSSASRNSREPANQTVAEWASEQWPPAALGRLLVMCPTSPPPCYPLPLLPPSSCYPLPPSRPLAPLFLRGLAYGAIGQGAMNRRLDVGAGQAPNAREHQAPCGIKGTFVEALQGTTGYYRVLASGLCCSLCRV